MLRYSETATAAPFSGLALTSLPISRYNFICGKDSIHRGIHVAVVYRFPNVHELLLSSAERFYLLWFGQNKEKHGKIYLPCSFFLTQSILSPSYHRQVSKSVRLFRKEAKRFLFFCGSGSYSFSLSRRCRYQQTLFEKLGYDIAHEAICQIAVVFLVTDTPDRKPFSNLHRNRSDDVEIGSLCLVAFQNRSGGFLLSWIPRAPSIHHR